MDKKLIKNLAIAVVDSGVNVKSGDEVYVITSVYATELTREVVKRAYERGAKRVIVKYRDGELDKLDYRYQTEETLTHKPKFIYDERNYFADVDGCVINIICEDPNALESVDAKKITASRRADMKGLTPYYDKAMSHKIKWSIIAYPHPDWAKLMFPDLDEAAAYEKLGEYIAKTTRVDNDDPVAAWKAHSASLARRCEKMNAAKIKRFHYKNALGTDVWVGMPENYVFAGGAEDCNGEMFNANMPTEEIFSAPDCNNIDGTIKAALPLCYQGKIIEGLELKLEKGRIVSYDAKTNKDVLGGIIETDDGAKSLGEIALVPYDSPISSLQTLFYETLFDENASCHFAIGRAYPTCVKGGDSMSKKQLKKVGINDSDVHVDFMVGTKDLEITAETVDGKTLKIFENGNFTKEFD